MEDIFNGVGIRVKLKNDDDFLKIRETLTRIGISSRKDKVLYQSCHILHKSRETPEGEVNHYYSILHFKELFILDGKQSNIDQTDYARRNTITRLLSDWELLEIENEEAVKEPVLPISQIKILPFKEKSEWELVSKYQIGSKKIA